MERDKLLNRIRKLYAMSQASESSPHEAEIALRRCQSLMSRYGITEADLDSSDFATTHAGRAFRSIPTHVRVLSSAVALLHDCLSVDMGDHMEFRGYSIDADVAAMSFDYLQEAMERSLRRAKEIGEVPGGRKASYDYRIGYAFAVVQRCRAIDTERRAREENTTGGGTSLVVRKLAMVRQACGEDLVTSSRKVVRYRPGAAHDAGHRDGRAVSLRSEIEKA